MRGILCWVLLFVAIASAGHAVDEPLAPLAPESAVIPLPMSRPVFPSVWLPEQFMRSPEGGKSLYEKMRSSGVRAEALERAILFFHSRRNQLSNKRYLSLVDFSKRMDQPRFYVFNLENNTYRVWHVSHGVGSDPKHTGFATRFSNEAGSQATSLGFYVTGRAYQGSYGYSLRLLGHSASNSAADSRDVVIHGYYVGPAHRGEIEKYGCAKIGCLTQGCLGVPIGETAEIIDRLRGGSLIYAFR